jgi:hypothetical protein
VAPLNQAGEEFRLEMDSDDWTWVPPWLPHGWSRFVWEAAPRYRYLYGLDDALPQRADAIAGALQTLSISDDQMVCYYQRERPSVMIRLTRAALQRNIQAALQVLEESWSELWIGDQHGQWIIRASIREGYLYLPEEPDEWTKKQNLEEELWAVAMHLIKEYGSGALERAEGFIKDNLARDDIQGATFWHFVAERVEKLLKEPPARGS